MEKRSHDEIHAYSDRWADKISNISYWITTNAKRAYLDRAGDDDQKKAWADAYHEEVRKFLSGLKEHLGLDATGMECDGYVILCTDHNYECCDGVCVKKGTCWSGGVMPPK